MLDEVRDAIDNASEATARDRGRRRRALVSPHTIRRILIEVLRDLPDEMSVRELRTDLE
jgi:hypothetical protein